VAELKLPHGIILTAIHRGHDVIIPRGDIVLEQGDTVILGAEPLRDNTHINLKEIVLLKQNPWNGQYIRDLDISRQSVIIMIRRKGRIIIPKGSTKLQEGDTLLIHTKMNLANSTSVQI